MFFDIQMFIRFELKFFDPFRGFVHSFWKRKEDGGRKLSCGKAA